MFALKELQRVQAENKSIICLGLDLDPRRMPSEHSKSVKGMFEFAVRVIEATKDRVCAYKPNVAFYESLGAEGLSLLKLIIERIGDSVPVILDGKRGDIGNTAGHYADAAFKQLKASWVTLNPYMGYDSLRPFIEHKEKGVFILCLTSNPGSKDFQILDVGGKPLYRVVAEKVAYWNKENNCGLVVGATNPEQLKELREVAGNMPLLIPGVGAQGGSLEKAAIYGTDNFTKTALINVSRSVLYASKGSDFAERARAELGRLNQIVDSVRNGGTSQTADSQTPQPAVTEGEAPAQRPAEPAGNSLADRSQPPPPSTDNPQPGSSGGAAQPSAQPPPPSTDSQQPNGAGGPGPS